MGPEQNLRSVQVRPLSRNVRTPHAGRIKIALHAYRHRAVRALPARRSARRIGELLVEHTQSSHALTSIFLFTDTTVLASGNLFVRVLEVATERRPAVKSAVTVLARADVGRDTCVENQ